MYAEEQGKPIGPPKPIPSGFHDAWDVKLQPMLSRGMTMSSKSLKKLRQFFLILDVEL